MSLRQLRQLFYKMKDPVFDKHFLGIKSCTNSLTEVLKKNFGSMTMDEVRHPRSADCHMHEWEREGRR